MLGTCWQAGAGRLPPPRHFWKSACHGGAGWKGLRRALDRAAAWQGSTFEAASAQCDWHTLPPTLPSTFYGLSQVVRKQQLPISARVAAACRPTTLSSGPTHAAIARGSGGMSDGEKPQQAPPQQQQAQPAPQQQRAQHAQQPGAGAATPEGAALRVAGALSGAVYVRSLSESQVEELRAEAARLLGALFAGKGSIGMAGGWLPLLRVRAAACWGEGSVGRLQEGGGSGGEGESGGNGPGLGLGRGHATAMWHQ
eukprot:365615-Chlamydomonas_euryale.AAC.5